MGLVYALIWSGIGVYGLYIYFRHRRYLRTLPDTTGNRFLKRSHGLLLVGAMASLAIAVWFVAKFLESSVS